MADAVAGLDEDSVSAWLASAVPESSPPYSFASLPGGLSNLTFAVEDRTGRRWVLRRPPLGELAPTAHDMARESRILSAMARTRVPVPAVVGSCRDRSVTGAEFYVMEGVDGVVLHDDVAAAALAPAARRVAAFDLVDKLAAIHDVDPDSIGLGDLGRRDHYLERQLRRWKAQLDAVDGRRTSALDTLHARLVANVPLQTREGIVHGDYRLENCVLGADARIAGVLDWELCTLGDPLADFGLLLVYWAEPGDEPPSIPHAPTLAGGFPTRAELLTRYAAASGHEVPDVEFYVAFGYWRIACIVEGIHARHRSGAMGNPSEDAAHFAARAAELTAMAERAAAGLV